METLIWRQSVCQICDIIIFPLGFSFVLSPFNTTQGITKSSNAISSISLLRLSQNYLNPLTARIFSLLEDKVVPTSGDQGS